MGKKKYVVYALVDPRDHFVRYVGMTNDVYKRFSDHISRTNENFARTAWIQELRKLNLMVLMETLEEVETHEEAESREAYWIKHFASLKHPIFNVMHAMQPEHTKGYVKHRPVSLFESRREIQTEALRAVVKRLRGGETVNDIRKSLGITGGRALQEVNEALRILGEPEAQGEQ